jgi:hypothetical protein
MTSSKFRQPFTLTYESLFLYITLYVAVGFDATSVAMLTNKDWMRHLSVFAVFFLLQLAGTLAYLYFSYKGRVGDRHVDRVEDDTFVTAAATSIAFVSFSLADASELLQYTQEGGFVVAVKFIFSMLGLMIAILNVVTTSLLKHMRLFRLATRLDADARTSRIRQLTRAVRVSQVKDVLLFVTIFFWFLGDVIDNLEFIVHDLVPVSVLSGVVVFFFFLLTSAGLVYEVLHPEKPILSPLLF